MTKGNIWSNHSQHLRNWTVDLQEDTVVQLLQAEELQDLSWLWSHLVDTSETGNEQELGLWFNEEVSAGSGLASKTNQVSFTSMILLQVLDRSRLQFLSLDGVGLKLDTMK